MKNLKAKLHDTISFLRKEGVAKPQIGIILGSGLGVLAERVELTCAIPYSVIPHYPVSTVEGHQGRLVYGTLEGQAVLVMQGRFHYYEGYPLDMVTYPIRVMRELGIKTLIVTNAAGGINTSFQAGDLMLIRDHINLLGSNPLWGPNYGEHGERFPDMSEAYSGLLRKKVEDSAATLGITIKAGVYAAVSGPSYETPAEIRYLRAIGADAVGMSTVPEVIVANHAGMQVVGISCITNMAAGILKKKLNHMEVMETANRVKDSFSSLLLHFLQGL